MSKQRSLPRSKGGRPRNNKLDELERELGVTRRRASTILKEQVSENPSADLSPIAEARLRKLNLEADRLTAQIRAAKIEAALLEKTLITANDANRIFSPPHLIVKQMLSTAPKTLSSRLFNQSQKAIEQTLADYCNSVLSAALAAVERTRADMGDGEPIDSAL